MGRRSRKRGAGTTTPARARPTAPPRRPPERPRAPWHPVPIVELSVLIGLILLVWGVIRIEDDAGRIMLVMGMALGSLGGLDTALREHFSGFRSHTILIAALPATLTAGVLFFARAPWIAVPVAAVAVFVAAAIVLNRTFRRARPREGTPNYGREHDHPDAAS